MDGRARARAEGDVFGEVGDAVAIRMPGRRSKPHGVLNERRIHVGGPALALQRRDLLRRGHGTYVGRCTRDPLDDDDLLRLARVTDQHLHHEAVHLRLGQRVGALGFDRILRRHHQEWFGHQMGLAGDGDLAFLHHLEQRALHLRRRPIDLIGEQQVGEHGSQRGGEFAGLLVVDAGSHQVRRYEIGCELDALERSVNGSRERLDGERLGEPGYSLHEQVALREHGDHHTLKEMILADNDLLHLVEDALHEAGNVGPRFVSDVHALLSGCDAARTAKFPRLPRHSRWALRNRCR